MSGSSNLTAFEWYLLGSWFYPIAAVTAHIRLNKSRIAAEIFSVDGLTTAQELLVNYSVYRAPTYVGTPHAMVPFGGGNSYEWNRVYSTFRSNCGKLYWNYWFGQSSQLGSIPQTVSYISKEADLAAVIPVAEHNRFPMSFPLQLKQLTLPSGPLYFHRETGLVGFTKKELLKDVLVKTRFFGTVGIPSMALLMFALPWGFHKINKATFPDFYKAASPPTNIIAKIRLKLWEL